MNTKIDKENHINLETDLITATTADLEREANILYQRMGRHWYSFCEVDGEIYIARMTNAEVHSIRRSAAADGSLVQPTAPRRIPRDN